MEIAARCNDMCFSCTKMAVLEEIDFDPINFLTNPFSVFEYRLFMFPLEHFFRNSVKYIFYPLWKTCSPSCLHGH